MGSARTYPKFIPMHVTFEAFPKTYPIYGNGKWRIGLKLRASNLCKKTLCTNFPFPKSINILVLFKVDVQPNLLLLGRVGHTQTLG